MSVLTGTLQQRRDTAANWTSANPTLLDGEVGWETDTRRGKLGDGVTAWNSLAYLTTLGPAVGEFDGMIEAPVNKTYTICESAAFAFTINTLIAKTTSGTLSAAVHINGTPVTGINTLAVTSTQATGTASDANSVSVGQRVTLVVTSASAPNDLSYTLKYTR